ncbi:hypothetical protein GE061_007448 [Apolygus lucorum]|uniref:Uncharacterized protein n=1 Tax=Apolygus lucorum TaxID=248454 RepID=A0A8S9WRQ7_APOLU|nr:hypothetical protein GE061_007448 [Apolygus lucorum]
MLRGAMNDGRVDSDPFLSLPNIPDLEDGISLPNINDSVMSDWGSAIIQPDELISDLLGLSGSGLLGGDSDLDFKSPEKFQDLRYTSTPKSKTTSTAVDSGFGEDSTANKSIEYKVVLNDITDKLKAEHFTSLSDVCDNSPNVKVISQVINDSITKTPVKRPSSTDENKGDQSDDQEKVWERNVSIIRRRIRTIPACRPANILARGVSLPNAGMTSSTVVQNVKRLKKKKPVVSQPVSSCAKCSCSLKESGETEISEAELLYYTGIKKHKSALGVVKFTRLPEFSKVTAFKRMLITIMKLRFDFPYEDLGFRLREGTDLVRHIISSTAAVLGIALSPFIPWLEPLTSRRTQKRVFYLHEIADSKMKVVVLLEDKASLPICYVSDAYDPSFDGIHIVTATVAHGYFADSDLVCTLVDDNPLFYRIVCTDTETTFKLAEGRFNEAAVEVFLGRNQNFVKELSAYLATDIKRRTPTDVIQEPSELLAAGVRSIEPSCGRPPAPEMISPTTAPILIVDGQALKVY